MNSDADGECAGTPVDWQYSAEQIKTYKTLPNAACRQEN